MGFRVCRRSFAPAAGLLLISALGTACASRGAAVPRPFPTPGDRPAGVGTPGGAGTTGTEAGAEAGATGGAGSGDAAGGTAVVPWRGPLPSPLIQGLLSTAVHLIGTPYRNGGSTPDGFDCSGFVFYVFAQQGVFVPRTVADQAEAGNSIDEDEIKAGDLVFFRTSGRRATHVGIALGPDRFVHAPSARGEVRIEPFARKYWADRFLEARRLF